MKRWSVTVTIDGRDCGCYHVKTCEPWTAIYEVLRRSDGAVRASGRTVHNQSLAHVEGITVTVVPVLRDST